MNTQLKTKNTRKLSRNELANKYRESEFFFSFPWETDGQVIERFEREGITTFEGLANTIANYWINFGVSHLLNFNCYPLRLDEFALIQFDEHVEELKALGLASARELADILDQRACTRDQLSQIVKAFEGSTDLQRLWIDLQGTGTAIN